MDVVSIRSLTGEELEFVSGGGVPVPAPRPNAPDCSCGPPPTQAETQRQHNLLIQILLWGMDQPIFQFVR